MTKARQFRKRFGDPQPGSAEPGKMPGSSLRTVRVFGKLRTTMKPPPEPRVPGPRDCLRTPGLAVRCDTCGGKTERMHAPLKLYGFYCANCCPVCGATLGKVAAAGAVR